MTMNRVLAVAVLFVCASAVRADDKPKVVVEERVVVTETVQDSDDCNKCGGKFKRFWIHTVGGTIGNGLKGGAKKVERTFN